MRTRGFTFHVYETEHCFIRTSQLASNVTELYVDIRSARSFCLLICSQRVLENDECREWLRIVMSTDTEAETLPGVDIRGLPYVYASYWSIPVDINECRSVTRRLRSFLVVALR